MRATRLIPIALAATLAFGTGNAEENRPDEVLVVTAERPAPIEADIEVDVIAPSFDYAELMAVEPPKVEEADAREGPRQVELALGKNTAENKS